jgi:predicted short-subunit dehydrogenase-like oxidoreductase (DUF2520 family)
MMTPSFSPSTPPTLNIIGCGRVGQTLGHLWHAQQVFSVQDVLTTSLVSAKAACAVIGAGRAASSMQTLRSADVWMMGVPDAHIADCAAALAGLASTNASARTTPPQQGQLFQEPAQNSAPATPLIFHCSGAMDSSALAPLTALGWQVASAHCILSFANVNKALTQFNGTPCALEGDDSARDGLHSAFSAIGAHCFTVKGQDKLLYHAAAVFATNFLPVLQNVAEDLWRNTGVPVDLIPGLRDSLLHNAVANIIELGPRAALTGPAARGDTGAIARQSQGLAQWNREVAAAYDALSTLALRMAKPP